MNDEPARSSCDSKPHCALPERLAHRPALLARLHHLLDTLEQSVADGSDAHAAEERVIEQLRQLGQDVLRHWADEAAAYAQAQVRHQHPQAIQCGKKKLLKWQTTFGWIAVEETQWRLGRRGSVLRPFCTRAAVAPRGTSRRLQRVLVDFGAEESFARAVQRVREHYGVDVALGRLRRHTLAHGAQMSALVVPPPKVAAAVLVTQMDGSLIPIVTPAAHGADRRKGKQLHWREVRLCLARAKESATARYGATLGSVGVAGALWRQTALAAGLDQSTRVHGVGDGADWITTQFQEQFGPQGAYLVDFWHVSEYLGAAASVIHPQKAQTWRRRQQGRLLDNNVSGVLRALTPHVEPATQAEAPVRAAQRYLSGRREQLDYAGARAAGLPIGSGEVESGHRHVIQQRLKLAGCWWKEPNAEAMLGLRVARANQLWDSYWHHPKPILN